MTMGQTSGAMVALCDGIYWIKCDDGIHWTPLDVSDRIAFMTRRYTKYVFYSYLLSKEGTVFFNQPKYIDESTL